MTHPELNPEHQAVADAARAKVMEMIARSKLVVAEVIVGDLNEE